MRIRVKYEYNPEYHGDTLDAYNYSYVYDLDKIEDFIEKYSDDDFMYSIDEAKEIVSLSKEQSKNVFTYYHDKYTFYDTQDERELVLSEDQTSEVDYEIYTYINM